MEVIGLLAPFAFVLALGALSQAASLKKEVQQLKADIAALKDKQT